MGKIGLLFESTGVRANGDLTVVFVSYLLVQIPLPLLTGTRYPAASTGTSGPDHP